MANEEKSFHRQLPLLEEVRVIQTKCEHDTIVLINQGTITCAHCGAMWIK